MAEQMLTHEVVLRDGRFVKAPKKVLPALKEMDNFLGRFTTFRQYKSAWTQGQSYIQRSTRSPTGRLQLFSNYNPWGSVSTRFSSYDPNSQNVGANAEVPIRDHFGPDDGRAWYSFDYSQLEIRIMATASGDPTLEDILKNDGDQHVLTQEAINAVRESLGLPPITRKQAKNINFAWQYGAGRNKLSAMAGIDAEEFDAAMRARYPGVTNFMDQCIAQVRQHGFVTTLLGYPLQCERHEAYKGTNYVIQGSAGDFLKNSMIAVDEYLESTGLIEDFWMILSIHDELVFECRKPRRGHPTRILRTIQEIMASAGDPANCHTPVSCKSIGKSWHEFSELDLVKVRA
jgi:DNA polymerase-1